jgi:hypothetical protein
MARVSTASELSAQAQSMADTRNKNKSRSLASVSAGSEPAAAVAHGNAIPEVHTSMSRVTTTSEQSAQAQRMAGTSNKSTPRSTTSVSAGPTTNATIVHANAIPEVQTSMARVSTTDAHSAQAQSMVGTSDKSKPRSIASLSAASASTTAIAQDSAIPDVHTSMARTRTANEHSAQAQSMGGTNNKIRARSIATSAAASASAAAIDRTEGAKSSVTRMRTTNEQRAHTESMAGTSNRSKPQSVLSSSVGSATTSTTAHQSATPGVHSSVTRVTTTEERNAQTERMAGNSSKSKSRVASLSAASATTASVAHESANSVVQSSAARVSVPAAKRMTNTSNKSTPRSIASLSAASATTAAIAQESATPGIQSSVTRMSASNDHSSPGQSMAGTRNKSMAPAITSASAASATADAMAHERVLPEVNTSMARVSTTNEHSAQSSNSATALPPAYEKRSSNAIAQRALLEHQSRRSKQFPAPIQTKNTAMINGNKGQSGPLSSASQYVQGEQLTDLTSPRQSQEPSMSPTKTNTSGLTPTSTSLSTSGAKMTTNTDNTALSLRQNTNSLSSLVKADTEEDRIKTTTNPPITVTLPPTSGSPMDMDVSDGEVDDNLVCPPTTSDFFPLKIIFPADIGKPNIACYVDPRPAVEVEFTREFPSKELMKAAAARFSRWEPFWVVEKALIECVTAPIKRKNHVVDRGDSRLGTPNTTGSFTIDHLWQSVISYLHQNSKPVEDTPKDGEYRVLIRMLPLKLSEYQKEKRADCHLWPVGTYLHVTRDGERQKYPQHIVQRKQQAHDKSKWLYQCFPHDFSSFVQNHCRTTDKVTFELCCHDNEQYFFSLALCKYRSPQSLSRDVKKGLKKLTLEASFQRAKDMMKNNEISLDSDEENNKGGGGQLGRTLFSLQDPISKVAIVTPVRGKRCRHFSVSADFFL